VHLTIIVFNYLVILPLKTIWWEVQTRAYVFVLHHWYASSVVATYPLLCGVCVIWLHTRVKQSVDRKLGGMDGGWDMDRGCKHPQMCEGVPRAEDNRQRVERNDFSGTEECCIWVCGM